MWMDVDVALSGVPINVAQLIDDSDFKAIEASVVFNQAGLVLVWNFVTTAGVYTQTAVTPTDTAGDYDWVNKGNGYYSLEIPASGGASINNDAEGLGWFSGIADGILPWRGPTIGFRAAPLNDALIDGGDTLDVNVTTQANLALTAQQKLDVNAEADAAHITYDAPTSAEMDTAHALLATVSKQDVIDGIVDTILLDTGELQLDDVPGLIAALNDPTAAVIADAVWDEPLEDHDTQGNTGWSAMLCVYSGSAGPGVYVNDGAANTNTISGTDGTAINPVSTLAAARTIADAIGVKRYYFTGADLTLAAAHEDWNFIGINEVKANIINLGSQDVDRSHFFGLTIEGTQGGTGRIEAVHCALQDPGAGDTTFNIFAKECGIVDRIQVDTSADNIFEKCFSLVAGPAAPIIQATGAAGTISIRSYSGGIEFESLSASHNLSVETDGQVIFNASCSVNATVVLRGNLTITDNTAGMNNLTVEAVFNRAAVNAEADTALGDYDGPTSAEMDTGHALLATEAKQDIIDTVIDTIDTATGGLAGAAMRGTDNAATAAAILTTALTEAYAADGAAGTLTEILYALQAFLQERAVSGTTLTVKKLDGAATAMTFTLDDQDAPTSITRAT